jgi:hypothetical protein
MPGWSSSRDGDLDSMEVPDEQLPLIIESLEHRAYMKAVPRDDRPYLELVEKLKRKPPASEKAEKRTARKSG